MLKDALSQPSFRRLILAQLLSKMADGMLLVGIAWYIVKNFNSETLAFFLAIVMFPYFLAIFVSGRFTNRFSAIRPRVYVERFFHKISSFFIFQLSLMGC